MAAKYSKGLISAEGIKADRSAKWPRERLPKPRKVKIIVKKDGVVDGQTPRKKLVATCKGKANPTRAPRVAALKQMFCRSTGGDSDSAASSSSSSSSSTPPKSLTHVPQVDADISEPESWSDCGMHKQFVEDTRESIDEF